jgi:septal ring factor EnvC (AmiA/AmiB activator)
MPATLVRRLTAAAAIAAVLAAASAAAPATAADDIGRQTEELRNVERQIGNAKSRTAALDREREALQAEMADVSQRLVDLAGNIQTREARIMESEKKLEKLSAEEAVLREKLKSRRAALAELLAGLQRLERNPPPPLAVDPHDAARAVRGSLLFGAVVPNLNGQAARLARELAELDAVRQRILATRAELDTNVANLAPARAELEALLARKKDLLAKTNSELEAERKRAEELARKAEDIRELLASLAEQRRLAEEERLREEARMAAEAEAARLKAEAEAARLSAEQREAALRKAEEERKAAEAEERRRLAALQPQPDREPVRFAHAVGKLAWPAQGERVRKFGDRDGFGGTSEGIFIATGKQAQITAPADGDVEFAGEFRSYGKLVIVNVGDGYHLLLAGLDTISVTPGQKLAAGEPVGSMGEHPARATLIGDRIDDPRPILYVEVRKGANAIDSAKWWQNSAAKAAYRRNNGGNEG